MYKNFTKKLGVPKGYIHNVLRIMRLTTVILIATFMQVSAAGFAQRVTLNEHNASLENVLKEIRQQTGYDMIFDRQLVLKANPVNISVKDVNVDDALEKIIANQSLAFSIEDNTITIKEKVPTLFDKLKKALTPPTDIIGRVTNTHGQPLNGATVTIKRTQSGTLTDANGNFTIRQVIPSDTLVISYLGYKRAFIRIGEQKDFKIILEEATNQLDQVVIQAYGETSQRLATGNIGTVSAKDIEKHPVMNVLDALQGQVPGAVVTNTSGYASAPINVEIRGRNSLNTTFPSDPLYVIDGVPLTILSIAGRDNATTGSQGTIQAGITSPAGGQSPFFNINPQDIESISVLKDADATAIYGSRAGNGVILITTKKGQVGKPKLEANINSGISEVPGRYDMLNTQQYIAMRKQALGNDNLPINDNTAPDLTIWKTNRYTDWQKYEWGNVGKQVDASLILSGGTPLTTYRISGNYRNQQEIQSYAGADKRGSFSLNINQKSPNGKLNVTLTTQYTATSTNLRFLSGAITLPPDAPAIFDETGKLNYSGWAPLDGSFPFGPYLEPYTSSTKFLNSSLLINYELAKGLVLRSNFGYNNTIADQSNTTPIAAQNPRFNPSGAFLIGSTEIHNTLIEPQIEYNGIIGKSKLTVLAGGSAQTNTSSALLLGGYGYTIDALLSSVSNSPQPFANNNSAEYLYNGVFGRINYNYADKYILSFNARRDGSSRFGPGRQYGTFGSVGAAWIFSEEAWLKNNFPLISFGKIRASYGTTGSDQIPEYQFISRWSLQQYPYNQIQPANPVGHTDSTLHWEVDKKAEIALSLAFLKDRISIDLSWYRNRCNNQLIPFPTPSFTGFTSVYSNSPADVQNSGFEGSINAHILNSDKFKWDAKFTIGINRNKLIYYPNLAQSPYSGAFEIGKPVNLAFVLHYSGVDPQTGLYSFTDKNHDGKITIDYNVPPGTGDDDRYAYDLTPKFDGGFTNSFTYKKFQLSLYFYFRKQNEPNALATIPAAGQLFNVPVVVYQNTWQKPGDIAQFARLTTQPNDISFSHFNQSDGVYSDASFIRLQNVSLSYSFDGNLVKKIGLTGANVFARAENLFVLTRYNGLDPEVHNIGSLPQARVISAGINFTF